MYFIGLTQKTQFLVKILGKDDLGIAETGFLGLLDQQELDHTLSAMTQILFHS